LIYSPGTDHERTVGVGDSIFDEEPFISLHGSLTFVSKGETGGSFPLYPSTITFHWETQILIRPPGDDTLKSAFSQALSLGPGMIIGSMAERRLAKAPRGINFELENLCSLVKQRCNLLVL
jgi:hypothetical protein